MNTYESYQWLLVFQNEKELEFKTPGNRAQWLTSIISATLEAVIGRLTVQSQPRQKVRLHLN
jgi:hypothetical protein